MTKEEKPEKSGTKVKNKLQKEKANVIFGMIKKARKGSKITQHDLAKKLETDKGYISKLENGKKDIRISSLIRIVEQGLGKKLEITIK